VTWQMQWAGLTIGGDSPYQLVEVSGVQDSPDVRTSDADRARASGEWAGNDLVSGRTITATVEVVASDEPTIAAFKSAMTVATGPERPLTLQFPGVAGGDQVTVGARVRRLSLPVNRRYQFGHATATVQWRATDPRIYSIDVQEQTVAVFGGQDNGVEFDMVFDAEFGGVVPRGAVPANNDGNFPAPWSVTFDGPVTNPRIENQQTGQRLEFIGTVPGGSRLVVGSMNRTVQLDGASRYQWLKTRSQWFDLEPGVTTLRLAAESGTGSATLTYRSAWI
jgi:hypothetical protein